ncbi:MAG: hypothetical protein C5B47_07925 [Verrucomicrobia bacterium]|nr:MAG: hypothetical protein C5B47_07925 [Verrucomicrobiota bacterium]
MTGKDIQQISGLLVNAGLAMSTLIIFFLARSWVRKDRRMVAVELRTEKNSREIALEISNICPETVYITSVVWDVGLLLKTQLTTPRDAKIIPGDALQLVLKGPELRTLYKFLLSALKGWPFIFAAACGIRIAVRIAGNKRIDYQTIRYCSAKRLLKMAREDQTSENVF